MFFKQPLFILKSGDKYKTETKYQYIKTDLTFICYEFNIFKITTCLLKEEYDNLEKTLIKYMSDISKTGHPVDINLYYREFDVEQDAFIEKKMYLSNVHSIIF